MCNSGFIYGSVSHPITFDFVTPGKQPIPNTNTCCRAWPPARPCFLLEGVETSSTKGFPFPSLYHVNRIVKFAAVVVALSCPCEIPYKYPSTPISSCCLNPVQPTIPAEGGQSEKGSARQNDAISQIPCIFPEKKKKVV